jgi:flagellar biosynthesis protein FlhF
MRVSTYFAATLPEAMAKVREALGPSAIVLSWRHVRGGIEISASVQSQEAPLAAPKSAGFVAREDTLAHHFRPDDLYEAAPQPKPAPLLGARNPNITTQRGMGALLARPAQPQHARQALPLKPKPAQSQTTVVPKPIEKPQQPSLLTPFLVRAGLTGAQATKFAKSSAAELRRALIECLSTNLKFAPIEAIPPKPIVLVGPAGGGKSACVAKLAARTLAAGHEVLLISADAERCGGADQLAALAKRLGTRFTSVTTVADLNEMVMKARQRGMVVYVDAPSASPLQPADMRATQRLIEETRLNPILCLPADMRPDDQEDLVLAYGAIGITRAIVTRLDLTNRRASAFYALSQADMGVAQVSATPYISGGVAIATAQRLCGLLLEPFEDALEPTAKGQVA